MTENKLLVVLPFSGFYESIHAYRIEQYHGVTDDDCYCSKKETEENIPTEKREYPTEEELQQRYDSIDWAAEFHAYAQQYCDAFAKAIGVPLEFESLQSPREYNFSTDRIFAYIPTATAEKIYADIDKTKLAEKIKEEFTSCDGFSSHYSAKLEEWSGDVSTWDHNELATLLAVYAEQETGEKWPEYEYELIEDIYC